MSERSGGAAVRDQRRPSARRQSPEAAVSPDFLESLERKRKQLDESIHKYIAAKEREYRNYERDLRQQWRLTHAHDEAAGPNGALEKPPSESGSVAGESDAHRLSAVDSLLTASSGRRGSDAAADENGASTLTPEAPMTDGDQAAGVGGRRRPAKGGSSDGQAPDGDALTADERASSAPELLALAAQERAHSVAAELARANSDPVAQIKPKRPPHMQLVVRRTSSGSSADGRLTSAMRSPTQPPKGKRVSLQVGDEIVTPSAPVPQGSTTNSSSSHSRLHSPVVERERPRPATDATTLLRNETKASEAPLLQTSLLSPVSDAQGELGLQAQVLAARAKIAKTVPPLSPRKSSIDADGDLFDLDDEDLDLPPPAEDDEIQDLGDQSDEDLAGRIDPSRPTIDGEPSQEDLLLPGRPPRYDPEAGLVTPDGQPAVQLESTASRQPTQPGFRRPSVVRDPVYLGSAYDDMEQDAAAHDLYGSSFSRTSKGSFTAGSLGESFMERNAEEMMRLRVARQQQHQPK